MDGLPSGFEVVGGMILGFISFVVGWAMFIGLVWAIRSGLSGFLYHMEDTTTGLLLVSRTQS
jgi:hypothetical protein